MPLLAHLSPVRLGQGARSIAHSPHHLLELYARIAGRQAVVFMITYRVHKCARNTAELKWPRVHHIHTTPGWQQTGGNH